MHILRVDAHNEHSLAREAPKPVFVFTDHITCFALGTDYVAAYLSHHLQLFFGAHYLHYTTECANVQSMNPGSAQTAAARRNLQNKLLALLHHYTVEAEYLTWIDARKVLMDIAKYGPILMTEKRADT